MKYIFILAAFLYLSCHRTAYVSSLKSEIVQYQLEHVDTLLDICCGEGYFDRQIFDYYPHVFLVLENLPNPVFHFKKGQAVGSTWVKHFVPAFLIVHRVVVDVFKHTSH